MKETVSSKIYPAFMIVMWIVFFVLNITMDVSNISVISNIENMDRTLLIFSSLLWMVCGIAYFVEWRNKKQVHQIYNVLCLAVIIIIYQRLETLEKEPIELMLVFFFCFFSYLSLTMGRRDNIRIYSLAGLILFGLGILFFLYLVFSRSIYYCVPIIPFVFLIVHDLYSAYMTKNGKFVLC